jgi:hypothetical protein
MGWPYALRFRDNKLFPYSRQPEGEKQGDKVFLASFSSEKQARRLFLEWKA